MAKSVTVDLYGVEGTGRTVTEAKQDAGTRIESFFRGSHTPEVLHWRGYVALAHRLPGLDWCYGLVATPEGVREGPVMSLSGTGYATAAECLKDAGRHLADLGYQEEDDLTPPPFLVDPKDVAEFVRKVKWQRRYTLARGSGLTDWQARHWAGHAPGFDLWDLSEALRNYKE